MININVNPVRRLLIKNGSTSNKKQIKRDNLMALIYLKLPVFSKSNAKKKTKRSKQNVTKK